MPNEHSETELKTLRLASPPLTREVLSRFVAYRRALSAKSQTGSEAAAAAHLASLEETGLTLAELSFVHPICTDFASRRSTAAELLSKREGKSAEVQAKIDEQRASLLDEKPLRDRYGDQTVDLLLEREEELIALHRGWIREGQLI
jgi:hypothetical protein